MPQHFLSIKEFIHKRRREVFYILEVWKGLNSLIFTSYKALYFSYYTKILCMYYMGVIILCFFIFIFICLGVVLSNGYLLRTPPVGFSGPFATIERRKALDFLHEKKMLQVLRHICESLALTMYVLDSTITLFYFALILPHLTLNLTTFLQGFLFPACKRTAYRN